MCQSFFKIKDAIESSLPTHDEPEVVPTRIHGSKHVKEVIYIKIITYNLETLKLNQAAHFI